MRMTRPSILQSRPLIPAGPICLIIVAPNFSLTVLVLAFAAVGMYIIDHLRRK